MFKKIIFFSITAPFLFLLVLLAAEGFIVLCLNFPAILNWLPEKAHSVIQHIYIKSHRDIIRAQPEMSRFDQEFAYTLKPGTFYFQGTEFNNKYSVNSLGLRDDEDSLKKPEIISTGDSFGLGWGVEQDETYAQLIEKQSGIRVLNSAISSYGTAREILFLRRIDTSSLKYLIIQYNANDIPENASFLKNINILRKPRQQTFENAQDNHQKSIKYYPFKYIQEYNKTISKNLRKKSIYSSLDEARMFLNVLNHSPVNLDRVTIIVMDVDNFRYLMSAFSNALEKIIRHEPDYAKFQKNLKIMDLSKILKKSDFHILDDHLNSTGHQKIAQQLLTVIGPK